MKEAEAKCLNLLTINLNDQDLEIDTVRNCRIGDLSYRDFLLM